jgi:hypothetical protein
LTLDELVATQPHARRAVANEGTNDADTLDRRAGAPSRRTSSRLQAVAAAVDDL